jgi:outer membrane protein
MKTSWQSDHPSGDSVQGYSDLESFKESEAQLPMVSIVLRPLSIFCGCLTVLCALTAFAFAAEETELSLDQVVEIALKRNPGIVASEQQMEGARARVTQSTAAYWPQVTGSAAFDRQRIPASGSGLPASVPIQRDFNNYSAGLSASQYLYDFGQTTGLVQESRYNLSASREGLASTLADVVQQVKKTYYEVLKNQRLVQVAEETLSSREKHLEQASAFYQVGLRPKIEVARAEVDVANARQNLIQARFNRDIAFVNLENVLGGRPVSGPYRVQDAVARPMRPTQLEPLLEEALKARSEVLQLEAQIQAAEAHLHSSQGKYWPRLTGVANYGWENSEFPLSETWQFGAQMSWSIFNGFQTQGEVAETKARINQTRAQLDQTRLQVIQQVSQAYLGLDAAEQSIATSEVTVRQAQENMDLAEGRYRTGVGDAIEYTDAQVSLTSAKNTLVQATYIYLQALVDLDRAMGRGPRPAEALRAK